MRHQITALQLALWLMLAPLLGYADGSSLISPDEHQGQKIGHNECFQEDCPEGDSKAHRAIQEAQKEGRAYSQIYNRSDYPHWSDDDGDCMNTRHEILALSSLTPPKLSPNGCYVSSGLWIDPYSGKELKRASEIDIDHIIPLKWAHQHGAANWSKPKKQQFANDPENLLAVHDRINQQKGSKGILDWMPPNTQYHCEYLKRWVHGINKYSLGLNAPEKAKLNDMKTNCL
ncbi:HNH endonuclease family protein [Zhongshania aliphaticivorans]|nr:HNH endonuclease family protein [Zhongshania aliphaticivorans]